MDEGSTIGDRLRRLRGQRGMTQEELAAAAGVSREIISKLENGQRTTARLSTVSKLADGLDVEIADLVDRRDHLRKERDGGSVRAVRDALLNSSLLPGVDVVDDGTPTPLPELGRRIAEGWGHYWTGAFGELLASLPGLIGEARITHAAVGAPAVEPLALAYDLACSLMTQIGRTDLGAVAAERAITTAHDGDDELLWVLLHASYSWVLLHQGRFEEAERLVAATAERHEPSMSRGSEREIGVWGCLLTTAVAPAVGRDHDPAEYLSLAGAAAERLGRRIPVYQTSFSPATVAMQGTYGYAVLRRPGQALDAAKKIRPPAGDVPGDLTGISWGAHLMDVAQAHVDYGHDKAAVQALLEARSVSPVWFRHQPVARKAVTTIRERERRLSRETRFLARSLDL